MDTVLVLNCLMIIISGNSALQIIRPYPKNEIAIEGESLTVSCTARDTSGYPRKVIFARRSEDQYTYKEIQNSDRVYITNTTRNDTEGLTRTAVLHIKSAQLSDHYRRAPYQCWAYPAALGGQSAVDKLVFTLYVIAKSDLPRATVRGAHTTLGGSANLTCDVTYTGNQNTAPLESLAWVKNTKTIKNGSNAIDPLAITAAVSKDGGPYRCMAVVKLQASKPVNISLGTAVLNIKVQFLEAPTQVVGTKGSSVVLECPAEGYPLNITWLKRLENGQEVGLKDASNVSSIADRYVVTRPCSYCRYQLTINDLHSHDAGRYVCKANEGQHYFDLVMSDKRQPTAGSSTVLLSIQTVFFGLLVRFTSCLY